MTSGRGSRGAREPGPRRPVDLVAGTDVGPTGRTWRSILRLLAVGLLGLVAAGAFLASGFLLLLALALTPNPDKDSALLILKVIDVAGWLAIGIWLLVDWWHFRLRVLVPPVAAWLWTYVIAAQTGGLGVLNWGP
jgi:hypothetical protein